MLIPSLGTRPLEKSERGSGRRGKHTALECRRASDWFTHRLEAEPPLLSTVMIASQGAFIGNTNRKPLVQFKENETNKQDLLAKEVVGAQSSFLGPTDG